jgi:gas vesicle protein
VNKKVKELERQQKEKLDTVRGSYRQQLVNAIQKIAGEYKAYYDELLSGKSGRHDLRIKELKEK